MPQALRRLLAGLVVVLVVGVSALWFTGQGAHWLDAASNIGMPGGVAVGGPFALVDTKGRPTTDADFRGRWMLVFFGYIYCPDVCPTELQTMANAIDALGPEAAKIVPVFITIDPERDTPAKLGEYVKAFDPRMVGLTGSVDAITAVAKAYRVYYAKVPQKNSNFYLMDHSAFIYLIGPDGAFRALFRPGMKAQELAAALRHQMAGT
jgi:protein SCO1/2